MYESKYFIEKNEIKGIDWIPRGFFIFVAALFILMSVDVFLEDYTPLETVVGLFFHILPGFIIAGILKLTWKNRRNYHPRSFHLVPAIPPPSHKFGPAPANDIIPDISL